MNAHHLTQKPSRRVGMVDAVLEPLDIIFFNFLFPLPYSRLFSFTSLVLFLRSRAVNNSNNNNNNNKTNINISINNDKDNN